MKRSGSWLLLLVGLTAAISTFVGVASLVNQQAGFWRAEARAAVLPANSDPTYDAIYYDTLSNGQLVLTLAEVVRTAVADTGSATVDVRTVPETSVLVISADAGSPEAAESAVAEQLAAGGASITTLRIPYRLDILTDGTGTAELVAPSDLARNVVAAGAALAVLLVVVAGVPWVRRQLAA